MKVALYVAAFLVMLAAWTAMGQESTDKILLIVKNTSRADGLILVEPATPVIFGVTAESGNKALTEGDALNCKLKERTVPAIIEGQAGKKVATILFDCGKTKLVFKQLGAEAPEVEREQ